MLHKAMQVELVMKTRDKQAGVVLILIAFILTLTVSAYILRTMSITNLKAKQNEKTMQSLNAAKQALIAWAVNHPNTPGLMPYPDRNNDGNYDDTSDCYATNVAFAPQFVLGRLPLFKNDPNCTNASITVTHGLSEDFRDGTGERLWYEVSSNLLYDYSTTAPIATRRPPIINPSIARTPLVESWMTVRDRNGNVLSDRVAAVIIAPGAPLPNQDRSGGIANPNQYLDKITMADNTPYQNYGYSLPGLPQEFIVGDDYQMVAKNDPTYKDQSVEPYYFNDKLVYITIDELMYALEKRVLQEAKDKLNLYYATNNYLPFAASLGSTTNANQATQGNYRGLLPIVASAPQSCSCTSSSRTCACNFGVVTSTSFTRNSSNFVATGGGANAPTGACSVNPLTPKVCTCNGAGTCKRSSGAIQFSCNACGSCTATVVGTNEFTTTGTFSSSTGVCSISAGKVTCPNSADGTFLFNASADLPIPVSPAVNGLPAWFSTNKWQDYITYSVSSNCTSLGVNCTTAAPQLTVGAKSNVRAILASPGAEIVTTPYAASKAAAQAVRSSCDIRDYLDSTENTNVYPSNGQQDLVYAPTETKSSAYNDQLVIVSP